MRVAQPTEVTYRRAPAEKREALLAAARDLFAEFGYERASTQAIAAAAQVSEGILFHHFGSKRGLFEGVIEEFLRASAVATLPDDPAELSEESVVRAAFDFADANPTLYSVLNDAATKLGEPESGRRSDVVVAAIERRLEEAMTRGVIRRGNARIMAELQFALVDAAYKAWHSSGHPERREEYIAEAVQCMQSMLAP